MSLSYLYAVLVELDELPLRIRGLYLTDRPVAEVFLLYQEHLLLSSLGRR